MKGVIAITRSPEDAKEFVKDATHDGFNVHALPTIQLISKGAKIVQEFLDKIQEHTPDYVVFMSSKAVKLLFESARRTNSKNGTRTSNDNTAPKTTETLEQTLQLAIANMTVVAVGPKTKESLESEGIKVNQMPLETYSSVGIGELFTRLNAVGQKVIVPRSGASTPFLKELLCKIGIHVVEIYLYDVCAFKDTSCTEWNNFRKDFVNGLIDAIVFTSASSVRGFIEIMSMDMKKDALITQLGMIKIVSIGPFTSIELEKFRVPNNIMSDVHTVAGALDTVRENL